MFGDDLGIIGAVAIPWHFDFHSAEITLNLFPALAVAVVATAASFCGVFFIAEMMAQFGIHCPLDQCLRELLQQPVWPYDLFGGFSRW